MEWSCVGHEKQKRYFERALKDEALAHAYLLAGPKGVGKHMLVTDIVRELVPAGYEPDRMELAPTRDEETGKTKDIPIEAIRELKTWLSRRPLGRYKCVVIDGAERLGDEAANTLLKVLEEPPSYVRFFLVTGAPAQVMTTIASRCEHMEFLPLTDKEMDQVLLTYKLPADDRELLRVVATGRPGLAVGLIQDEKIPIVAKAIAELQKLLKADVAERLIFAKKLADDEAADRVVGWWLAYVHSRLNDKPQLAPLAKGLMELSHVLAQSHYNRRLAIENFLLNANLPK
jgi:DNA polymerase-3 subunit delta'